MNTLRDGIDINLILGYHRVNEILWSFYQTQQYLGNAHFTDYLVENFFVEVIKRSIRPGSQEKEEFSSWVSSPIQSYNWDQAFVRYQREVGQVGSDNV